MTPEVTVVVEWDNAALAGADRARASLARLAEETTRAIRRAEVLICHDSDDDPAMSAGAGGLPASWRTIRVPDGRYYELKNHGAREAAGPVVAFLDSDAIPEPGWLEALLEPFADPRVQVVAGNTFIQGDELWTKAFALWWFFPLRAEPGAFTPTTHFFANNVAFRRETLRTHPFSSRESTSRGACIDLAGELGRAGVTIWRTTSAQVTHPAPRGWRHFALRALAQGRDRLARERGWRATPAGSVATCIRWTGRGIVRTVRHHRAVDLPLAAVPAAAALCCAYYGLYFIGELATFARVPAVRRIRI